MTPAAMSNPRKDSSWASWRLSGRSLATVQPQRSGCLTKWSVPRKIHFTTGPRPHLEVPNLHHGIYTLPESECRRLLVVVVVEVSYTANAELEFGSHCWCIPGQSAGSGKDFPEGSSVYSLPPSALSRKILSSPFHSCCWWALFWILGHATATVSSSNVSELDHSKVSTNQGRKFDFI